MFLRDFNIITRAFSDPKFTKIKNNSFRIKIHEQRKRMIDQNLSVGSPYIYLCFDFIKQNEYPYNKNTKKFHEI